MKYVILLSMFLFVAGPASASTLMLNYYCGCRGKLEVNKASGAIDFTKSAEFDPCAKAFDQVYYDPYLEITGEYEKEFEQYTRKKDKDGKPICNNSEIKDYLSLFRKLQKEGEDILEEKVEVNICEANTSNKGKRGKIKECREALVDLLGEHEKVLYDECKLDFRNRGKGKQIDRCVRTEAYKLLLDTNDAKFYNDVCPKEPREAQIKCVTDIRSKLSTTYFKKEVAMCNEAHGFNTDASVKVCKDVLISKILAFSTHEERNKLLQCISMAQGDEAVKACVAKFLSPNDEDEKQLLDELSAKFCPEKDFPAADERQKCLEDILLENLQDLPLDEKCKAIQDKTEQKKCQRMALYQKMLDSSEGDVFDCWNRKKFDSMKKRAECSDKSKTSQEEIKKCLALPEPDAQVQCLQNLAKRKDLSLDGHNIGAEEAAKALDRLLSSLGVDTSSCQSAKDRLQCLNSLYENYKAQQAAEAAQGSEDGLIDDLLSKNTSGPSGGANALGGAAGAAAGLGIGANLPGAEEDPAVAKNLGSSESMKFSGGHMGLFKNLKRAVSYRKSPYASCKCLAQTGTISVFDRVRLVVGNQMLSKDLNANELQDQKEGFEKMEGMYNGQAKNMGTSVVVSDVKASKAAECQALAIEDNKKAETENLPPPTCGNNATAHVPDGKSRLYVQQLEKARNRYHAEILYEEWLAHINGEIASRPLDTVDMNLLMEEDRNFEDKQTFLTTVKLIGFFIPDAHANLPTQDVNTAALDMMEGAGIDKKEVATNIKSSKGSDPIAESQSVAKEAKTERKEYTTFIIQLLGQAKKLKAIKDSM